MTLRISPRSSLSQRSRTLLRSVSMLMVASSATGCVAAKNYDEARTVAESEAKAHARTRERLEAAMQRIHVLEGSLAERERSLEAGQNAAEESKLATTVATKEKEAANELVQELRSELARTGDHLLLFAREKRDMAETLLVAEQRMSDIDAAGKRLSELIATTRDLSLALSHELEQGRVMLTARDGQVVLALKPDALFAPSGDALVMEAVPVLAAVGKVSGDHPTLRVVLREPPDMLASARLQRLGDALRERGVAGTRLVLPSDRAAAPTSPPLVAAAPGAASPGDGPNASGAPAAPSGAEPAAPATAPVAMPSATYEIAFAP